jgi:dimethylaniline monooxygenase (N-oxide forming)
LPNRLACGSIIIKPNIKSFTVDGIIFDDGTSIHNVDEVIFSTGYSFGFPLAEDGKLIPVQDNHVLLYKLMYPVETSNQNTLAVIGLIQPMGSIVPISEIQARLFFNVVTGNTKLPEKSEMEVEIQNRRKEMFDRYVHSRRHTIQVDNESYMDGLADMIGCKPRPEKYLLTDPKLAVQLFFGGNMSYAYRLSGPHAWPQARDALLQSKERILKGCRQKAVTPSNNKLPILCLFSILCIIIAIFIILLL